MTGVRVRDGRTLPWFQVTKAETEQLMVIAEPRTLPYLRSLYFALLELANDQRADEVPASRSELAARSGVSVATVKRLTPTLVDGGLVRVEEKQGYASLWTVLGVGSSRPGGVGSASTGGSGLSDPGVGSAGPALKVTGQEGKKESPTDSLEREVWEHYRATRPNGARCKLGPEERRLIKSALAVRDLADCKLAITGLFKSDYHVSGGYIHLKYALRGGGTSPSPSATIDRLAATALNGNGNGRHVNGRPVGLLERQVWPDGRTWPELTRAEQENAKESVAMGIRPWEPRPEPVRVNGNGNGHVESVTAATILDD